MNVYFHLLFPFFRERERERERERDGFWVVGLAGDCNGGFHQLYLMTFFIIIISLRGYD